MLTLKLLRHWEFTKIGRQFTFFLSLSKLVQLLFSERSDRCFHAADFFQYVLAGFWVTGCVFMLEMFYFSWILIAVFTVNCSSEKEWFFFWNNCNICKNTVGYSCPTMQQKIKFISGIPYFCRQEWSLSFLEVKFCSFKKEVSMSFPCLCATVCIFLQGSFSCKGKFNHMLCTKHFLQIVGTIEQIGTDLTPIMWEVYLGICVLIPWLRIWPSVTAMINPVFWNFFLSSKSRMRTALWHFRETRITFSAASFCVASTSINLIWILRDFCQQLYFAFLIKQFFQNFNIFKANKLTFKGSKVKHGFAFWSDESSLKTIP